MNNWIVLLAGCAVMLSAPLLSEQLVATNASVQEARLTVGSPVPEAELHIITAPGRYGLGSAPEGSIYAVFDGHLVRVDEEDLKLQSVIFAVDGIRD